MKHAIAPVHSDYTLCGLAHDAQAIEPEAGEIVFATPGQKITCPDCRTIIRYCLLFGSKMVQPRE